MPRIFSGQRLRDARIAANLPLEYVALAVGRSAHSVRGYELGRTRPSSATVGLLADLLGLAIDDLFDEATDPTEDQERAALVASIVAAAPLPTVAQRDRIARLLTFRASASTGGGRDAA
ncbi:helix-turn-helix domain-containing protein [Nonomuraea typhae]|uniref:Helix-turn-helix domain-containing protein n=1 Tax=Nonomuraea typhae TaxID=2603600 RepID=A0ABW7YKL0_9ACTN